MFWRKLLLLTLILSFWGQFPPLTIAEDDFNLPPNVIDVYPFPGIEMLGQTPLTISFDQPMNAHRVEQALDLDPFLAYTPTWLDARTLNITPQITWGADTRYTLNISTDAESETGLQMEFPYSATIHGATSLIVAEVSPREGTTDLSLNAKITLSFNRAVVPLEYTGAKRNQVTPLIIEPYVRGYGEWVNTSLYVFTPTEGWVAGAKYQVKVRKDLQTFDGVPITDAPTWSFSTLIPRYNNVSTPNGLDGVVSISFNQPMDRRSTEAALKMYDLLPPMPKLLKQRVEGTFSWNEDSTIVYFQPAERLKRAYNWRDNYEVSLAPSALNFQRTTGLERGYTVRFRTVYPFSVNGISIRGFYWDNPHTDGEGRWLPGTRPTISFTSPINIETLEGRVEVYPKPDPFEIHAYGGGIELFYFSKPETVYTIILRAGIEDIYGDALDQDFIYYYETASIPPSVRFLLDENYYYDPIQILNGYRDEIALPFMVNGNPTLTFSLSKIAPQQLSFPNGANVDFQLSKWNLIQRVIGRWSQQVGHRNAYQETISVPLHHLDQSRLQPGLYHLTIDNHLPKQLDPTLLFAVATANLTVKRGPNEVLVWVTDLQDGQPLSHTRLTVYNAKKTLAVVYTDEAGVVRIPVNFAPDDYNYYSFEDDSLVITATGENLFGIWYSRYEPRVQRVSSYIYTDRLIYRPGETVYFKGFVRDRWDMDFSIPDVETINVGLGIGYDGFSLPEQTVELTDFGTFSGSFTLPLDAPLGYARVGMRYGEDSGEYYDNRVYNTTYFRVADYRAAGYEVNLTSPTPEIIQGDRLDFAVQARYFSGEPFQNADVYINMRGCPYSFDYENYRFYDETWDYQEHQRPYSYTPHTPGRNGLCRAFTEIPDHSMGNDFIYNGIDSNYQTPRTDLNGQLSVSTNWTTFYNRRPVTIGIEGRVANTGLPSVAGQTLVIAHPAQVYVGLQAPTQFIDDHQTVDINIVTVTPKKEILPRQTIEIEVEELYWVQVPAETDNVFAEYNWEMRANPILATGVLTDLAGKSVYRFIPPKAGLYRIHAYSFDTQGRRNSSTYRIYVSGDDFQIQRGNSDHHLEINTDKTSYKAGETAHFFIPMPDQGNWWALVNTERTEIGDYHVYEVRNGVLEFDLPITEDFEPNITVSVSAMRGPITSDPYPEYAWGNFNLSVEPIHKRLMIEIIPTKQDAEPQETVKIAVRVTDNTGKPVQAEVSLQMVDAAVNALVSSRWDTLEDGFYSPIFSKIWTDHALRGFKDRFLAGIPNYTSVPMRGGGGDGSLSVTPRNDFITTPLWEAHVVTDANGYAQVSVKMPDNLTRWEITAQAITTDTELKVGEASTTITTSLPFNLRPQTPRFMVVGDHLRLGATLINNTDAEQVAEVVLLSEGVTLDGSATQSITIPAKSQHEFSWWVRVEDVPYVSLVFGVKSEAGFEDAVVPDLTEGPNHTIPVYRYLATDTVGTGGILTDQGSRVEGISLPYRLLDAQESELLVKVEPSLAVSAIDAMSYLEQYPHYCIEQTVSRFLPNVMVYNAFTQLGIEDTRLKFDLIVALNVAQQKLRDEELEGGGWGWIYNNQPRVNPLVTAYAALGLIEAQKAGFLVDEAMLERAVVLVRSWLSLPNSQGTDVDLNRQAFYLYVLSRYGDAHLVNLNRITDHRRLMSHQGIAYLLMAYANTNPHAVRIRDLVSDLESSAIFTANGVHWEATYTDWYNWSSDVQMTALALSALVETAPDSPLLPQIVRWLLIARRANHWATTQETVWSIFGFTNWMVHTQELSATYRYQVSINNNSVAEKSVNPSNIRQSQTLHIGMDELDLTTLNRLTVAKDQDEGALYYTTYLNLKLDASKVPASSQGIHVERDYFLAENPEAPITSAQVGDLINVRVTFTLTQNVPYFVLEAPIASGMEMADVTLNTTTMLADGQHIMRESSGRYWSWGYWWFTRTELRDDKAVIYADNLPAGTYIYTYQVQATHPGEFQVIPTHGASFYFPELFGRSAGLLFTINQ